MRQFLLIYPRIVCFCESLLERRWDANLAQDCAPWGWSQSPVAFLLHRGVPWRAQAIPPHLKAKYPLRCWLPPYFIGNGGFLSVIKWRVMSIIQIRTSNIPPNVPPPTLGSNDFPSRTLAQRPCEMGSPTLAMRPFDLVALGRAKGSHASIYSVLLAQRQNSAACWFHHSDIADGGRLVFSMGRSRIRRLAPRCLRPHLR
jgi:hypothetical protein